MFFLSFQVENVARFLHFMDPKQPSLLFVRDREKTKQYLRELSEAKLTRQTQLTYLKSLRRLVWYDVFIHGLFIGLKCESWQTLGILLADFSITTWLTPATKTNSCTETAKILWSSLGICRKAAQYWQGRKWSRKGMFLTHLIRLQNKHASKQCCYLIHFYLFQKARFAHSGRTSYTERLLGCAEEG